MPRFCVHFGTKATGMLTNENSFLGLRGIDRCSSLSTKSYTELYRPVLLEHRELLREDFEFGN
jgi:hypothetical protein